MRASGGSIPYNDGSGGVEEGSCRSGDSFPISAHLSPYLRKLFTRRHLNPTALESSLSLDSTHLYLSCDPYRRSFHFVLLSADVIVSRFLQFITLIIYLTDSRSFAFFVTVQCTSASMFQVIMYASLIYPQFCLLLDLHSTPLIFFQSNNYYYYVLYLQAGPWTFYVNFLLQLAMT